MSRISEICKELGALKRKREELEDELHALQEKKLKDTLASLSHVPLDLKKAATAWKSGKVTRNEILHLWDLHWAQTDGDFFTFDNRNVFDIITDDLLEDVLDNMAEIYFDLETARFMGPFQYDSAADQKEAAKWRKCKSAFCAFAK